MLKIFADWVTFGLLDLPPEALLAETVHFFIYDTLKIFLLLAGVIFAVSLLRSFLPRERIKAILARKNPLLGHLLASFFGILTPFCTCSAIPLFLGFLEAGVPLGTTFSFLVASPMINEVALVLLLGMFGWKIALLYVFSGLLIAIFSGIFIDRLSVESLVRNSAEEKISPRPFSAPGLSWSRRIDYAKNHTVKTIKNVWPYILVGIGLGAWIHGYVPTDFLTDYASADRWYAVPLAVLIGIPLYSNAAGVIPLVGVLAEKGVAMGTSLSFMMAVTGLSLPEFLILKKVMRPKLILIFAGTVGSGIIFTGYLFNLVLG